MFRRKFIDRLRDKYQFGGPKKGLSNPLLTLQGKTINTSEGQRFGAGAKMSAPLLESRNYGKNTSGLRFETDFAGTNAGPISVSNKQKAYNASIGLRGFHNRYLNRDNSLSLNSNIGAGIGTGDSTGDNEMNPFVDANVSLLKSGRTKKGRTISGGLTGSYGTEGSSNQGLQLGLKGNYGRLSGNVGYDFTNKTPRAGVSLNFQTGGLKYNTMDKVQDGLTVAGLTPGLGFFPDALNTVISAGRGAYNYATGDTKRANSQMGDLALNAASMIPAAGQAAGALKLAKTANTLNKVAKVVKPLDKIDTLNSSKNLIQSTIPSTNNTVGVPLRNTTPKPTNSFMPTSISNNFAETGGVRKYHEGGMDESRGYGMEHMQEEHHTGGDTGGDTDSMYGPNSDNPTGPPMDYGASWSSGGGGLGGTGLGIKGFGKELGQAADWAKDTWSGASNWGKAGIIGAASAPLGIAAAVNPTKTWNTVTGLFGGKKKGWFEEGGVRHQTGGTKLQERLATSFSGSNIPARINMELLNEAVNNQYLDDRVSGNKSLNDRVSRGKYETIKKQTGGKRLPGGQMQPIPGSDAVQFNGQSHDQGGIMVDSQTEVEGGETMDKVNIAKKGGKRDYFFSSHLKEGGRSYADMHKEILANGGSQEEINMLAKMQEAAAGRDPKQVAKLGGMAEYQMGGQMNNPFAGSGDTDNNNNGIPDSQEAGNEEVVVVNTDSPTEGYDNRSLEDMKADEYAELYNKAKKKADKGRGTPAAAWVGMGAQMLPSMYAFLHKQKKPEDATYTQGFKSPIHSQTVKAQKLDRVNYNDKRSQLSSSIRGANKFIETSGGGPANMANLQASLAKDIMGQMQINAEETKANVAIDNREKQLAQQAALDNVKRSQAASTMNAQLARIEAARRDTIEGGNVTARNQWQSDQELNKMNALTSTAQGIAGGAGDIMSYKASERMARAIGSEGIYQRDIMRDFIGKRAKKDGIPGLCGQEGLPACTDDIVNEYIANKGVFQKTEEE